MHLREWLTTVVGANCRLCPLAGDAGMRRYFRVAAKGESFIALAAPPAAAELRSFAAARDLLASAQVNVPKIYALDFARGFALLSDFGDEDYAGAIRQNRRRAKALYDAAANALIKIQLLPPPPDLPRYDQAAFRAEMDLFRRWYVPRRKPRLAAAHGAALEEVVDYLARELPAAAPVVVHRDYHSRNLMVCADSPGILDFQDAVAGPPAYDPVSLWRDAYLVWDERTTMRRLADYYHKAGEAGVAVGGDFAAFARAFDLLGAQRHLKVLGIFTRLAARDGKRRYLADLPTVRRYLFSAAKRRKELRPLVGVLRALGDGE